ncbi:MotA/TolQ/ExbB proton channel family protein [Caldithrix abyssi]|nr:MotA/TolQ/ExbB proton channel family protein [Caldithrix abyssi]
MVRKAFFGVREDPLPIIDTVYELSQKVRLKGILSLESELKSIDNNFLRMGMELAVDGSDADTIRNVMETELSYLEGRHEKGQKILMALGTYAPGFGMIGTLIGLVGMLANMSDPTSIGPSMSVALVTTFYGSLASNLLFLPLAGKLKNKSEDEMIIKEMIVEGVLAIPDGVHPKNIRRKLLNFIPPKQRGDDI